MRRTWFATGVLALLACADGAPAPVNPPGAVDDLDRLGQVAKAYCDLYRRCCQTAGFATTGLTMCETMLRTSQEVGASIEEGKITLDPGRVSACLALLERNSCKYQTPEELAICEGLFVGTLSEGESCRRGSECAVPAGGAVICLFTTQAGSTVLPARGTCRRMVEAGRDQPCWETREDDTRGTVFTTQAPDMLARCRRREGLTCDRQAKACREVRTAGQTCASIDDCALGLYCLGTCQPPLEDGKACTAGNECRSSTCRENACSSAIAEQRACQD